MAPNLLGSNPIDYGVWRVLEEKIYKIRVIDLNALKQREQSGPSWIMSSLRQPFVSGVVDSSRSVIHVL